MDGGKLFFFSSSSTSAWNQKIPSHIYIRSGYVRIGRNVYNTTSSWMAPEGFFPHTTIRNALLKMANVHTWYSLLEKRTRKWNRKERERVWPGSEWKQNRKQDDRIQVHTTPTEFRYPFVMWEGERLLKMATHTVVVVVVEVVHGHVWCSFMSFFGEGFD